MYDTNCDFCLFDLHFCPNENDVVGHGHDCSLDDDDDAEIEFAPVDLSGFDAYLKDQEDEEDINDVVPYDAGTIGLGEGLFY